VATSEPVATPDLPKTASQTPLIALIGFVALAGGLALRRLRPTL